jgi:hypothetical protein
VASERVKNTIGSLVSSRMSWMNGFWCVIAL